jgi:hypothetical protein
MVFPVQETVRTFRSFYCASCRGTQRFFSFFDHYVCERCGRRLHLHRPIAQRLRVSAALPGRGTGPTRPGRTALPQVLP